MDAKTMGLLPLAEEFEVKVTLVIRRTVTHRIFAPDKDEAIRLTIAQCSEIVDNTEGIVVKPKWSAKKVNENTPPRRGRA